MSRWFRMYDDLLDDPKVQRLPADLFKAWVNLLCLASRNNGRLPSVGDVAFALRMEEAVADQIIGALADRGLIDEMPDGSSPHNWDRRQYKSDVDPTAAERQRAKRERDKSRPVTDDVTRDKAVTSHPPETDTEQIQNKTERESARAEESSVKEGDPAHWAECQTLLKNEAALDEWELDFVHSIKWKPSLTQAQKDSLKAIQDKLAGKTAKPYALPTVQRGTAPYDAWIRYYRRKYGKATFYEARDVLTVPSEYPPEEKAA